MRLHEMRRREDVDAIIAATLSKGWRDQFGRAFQVLVGHPRGWRGQTWMMQPTLSVLYVSAVNKRARRFIGDSLRYTPRRVRALAQWLAASGLSSVLGLRLFGAPYLAVTPHVPRAESLVIVPGNRRIRLFDLDAGVTRVLGKVGFPGEAVANELAVRLGQDGPFPRITGHDREQGWFEEDLVGGFSLPRCPPWRNRDRYRSGAFQHLAEWLRARRSVADASQHAERLGNRIANLAERVDARFGSAMGAVFDSWSLRLVAASKTLGEIGLSQTHGDFQPGNILVDPDRGGEGAERVLLIDWEYSAVRYEHYDPLVYGLAARFRRGLGDRLRAFVERGALDPPELLDLFPFVDRGDWRRSAAAMFLLEESVWVLEEALAGPYAVLLPGATTLSAELGTIKSWWRG